MTEAFLSMVGQHLSVQCEPKIKQHRQKKLRSKENYLWYIIREVTILFSILLPS